MCGKKGLCAILKIYPKFRLTDSIESITTLLPNTT